MAKNIGMTVMGRVDALFSEDNSINTVQDAYDKLGLSGEYTATVGGDSAIMSKELEDGQFVVFAKATKGGKQ